jgi:hypothetical protein
VSNVKPTVFENESLQNVESARSIVKDRDSFLASSSPSSVKKKIVPNQSILTMKPNRLSIYEKHDIVNAPSVPGTAENLYNFIVPAAKIENQFLKSLDSDKPP